MADMISIALVATDGISGPTSAAVGSLGRLEGAAGSVTGKMVGLAESAAKVAVAVGAISLTAFVGGMTAAVTTAASFEKQISAIGAVSGASAEQLKQFHDLALQLGKDTSFSASEAANGIEELAKAGVSLRDIMGGAAAASLNLAAAGGISVAESATIASNAMNTFSLTGSDMAHVADQIAGAANASAIDVHEFGFSLSSVGAVAATVGLSLDDTATSIAVLGQAGLKGSDAGTSLKTMLLNLTPSTKTAKAEMEQLGIVTADGANQFFDATGKAKSMAEIAGVLQNATKGLTEQQKLQALQTMFGTDAIRAAAIMARVGAAGFEDMAASIGKVSAADVANQRLDNLAGSVEKLKGTMEVASITIGEKFTPVLKRIVDGANELLSSAMPAIDRFATAAAASLDRFITRAQAVAPALIALGPAVLNAGRYLLYMAQDGNAAYELLEGLPAPVQRAVHAIGVLTATLRGAGSAIQQSLGGLNLGAIGAAGSGLFAGLASSFREIAPLAVTIGRAVVQNITDTFDFLATRVLPPVVSMVEQISGTLMNVLLPASAMTGATMRGILGDTLDWLARTVMPPFLNIVEETANFFTDVMLPTLPAIAGALRQTLGETVQWLATTVWPRLAAAATLAWGFISGTIAPAIPGVVALIRDGLGKALEWVGATGWPLLVTGATVAWKFLQDNIIPAVRDTVSWLQDKLPPAIAGVTAAWEAIRTRLTPIIQAVMSGDIATAIGGLGSAFADFATLAAGWIGEQAGKIDWAAVWSQTKDVLASASTWFVDAATRFGAWLGEQVAQINWADVWSRATAVLDTAAAWFVGAATLIAGWIGDQVAAIDWGSVWARAVNVVQGTAQWFVSIVTDWATWIGAQVAAIDWAAVWAQAKDVALGMAQWFVGAATQLAAWIGAEVAKIPWATVWANVTGMTAAMQTAFEAQAAQLDWKAITTANKSMATQIGQGIDEQIKATDWSAVGTSFADALFGKADSPMPRAWTEGWKLISGHSDIVKPVVDWITAIPWHDADVALAQAFVGFLQRAWDIATNSWKPTLPDPRTWFGPGTGAPPASGTPSAMPGGQGTTPQTRGGGGGGQNLSMPSSYTADWEKEAYQAAVDAGHPNPRQFVEQIREESSGNPNAYNATSGATGIAQIIPRYHPGVDPTDPHASLRYAANLMTQNYATYGDPNVALAAYNAGPGAVARAGGVPPYAETNRYISDINERTNAIQTVPMSQQQQTPAGPNMVTYRDQWGNEFTVPEDKFNARPGGNANVTVISRQQGAAAASMAGQATRPPSAVNMMNLPIKNQFDLGLPWDQAIAACGPAAVALFMEAAGRTPNAREVVQIAAKNGWTSAAGMGGVEAFKKTLSDEGVNYATLPTTAEAAQQSAAGGNLTAISTPGHYFVAQGFDPTSGKFDLGATGGGPGGALADPRASRFMSAEEITALEGPINGVIQLLGAVPPAADAAAASLPPITDNLQGVTAATDAAAPGITTATDAINTLPPATEAAGTGIDVLGAGLFDIATAGPAAVVPATEMITASFDLMAQGTLQSVTDMGAGVLTTTQDMAGNTIATVTDMAGQVTSQSATLASGVSLSMADMGTQSIASVDAMTGNITTVMTDMAGNTVTTVTTASGQVVSQFATMSTQAGSSVAQLANTSKKAFGAVGSAAEDAQGPIEDLGSAMEDIPTPDLSDAIGEFKKLQKAAEAAGNAVHKVSGGDFKKSESAASAIGGHASGGWVGLNGPELSWLGERGPEYVIPNNALRGGGGSDSGGTTIVVNVTVNGSVTSERDLIEAVRDGLIATGRRNASDVLSGGGG
jgi:TP901 family phage tail tape measure protein